MLKKVYDVIIIGAGPAGLMAARELEKAGIDYLVIDKKSKIGYPLKCAGAIAEKEFRRFFGEGEFDFIQNKISRQEIICENIHKVLLINSLKIDRMRFEEWLSKDLNIELECGVTDLSIQDDFVKITADKGIICSRFVILSYGCHFTIQKKLGLLEKEPRMMLGFGAICRDYHLDPNTFYYFLDKDFFQYLWVFPESKENANVGIMELPGPDTSQETMSIILKNRLKKIGLSPVFISYYGGLIPYDGPIRKTYGDRILVCGDAAGQVFAGTGEGIRYALQSGIYAAKTVLGGLRQDKFDGHFLSQYEDAWREDFSRHMHAGIALFKFISMAHKWQVKKYLLKSFSESQLTKFFLDGIIPWQARIISSCIW